jgi:hypothetical protein
MSEQGRVIGPNSGWIWETRNTYLGSWCGAVDSTARGSKTAQSKAQWSAVAAVGVRDGFFSEAFCDRACFFANAFFVARQTLRATTPQKNSA